VLGADTHLGGGDTGWRRRLSGLVRERAGLLALLGPHRHLLVVVLVLNGCLALVPAATALTTGWAIRSAPTDVTGGDVLAAVWAPVVLLAVLLLAHQGASSLREGVEAALAGAVDGRQRQDVRRLAAAPQGTTHLADAAVSADLDRAADIGEGFLRSPGAAAVGQLVLSFRFFTALLATVVVAQAGVLLAIGVLALSVATRAVVRRQWLRLAHVRDGQQAVHAEVKYWSKLGVDPAPGKEIRVFGLAGWVAGKRTDAATRWGTPVWRTRGAIVSRQHWTYLMVFCAASAALLVPGLAAVDGALPPDRLVTCVVAAWGVFAISGMGPEAFAIDYGLGAVRAHTRLRHGLDGRHSSSTRHRTTRVAPHIAVSDLSYRYDGADRPVLDGLSFRLRAGEVMALVGRNGAGKTTLVKLLTGLHTPDSGLIAMTGDESGTAWSGHTAVMFQDFIRYPLTVADNIALGAAEHRADRDAIRAAIDVAEAGDLVARLPRDIDTPLTTGVVGGVDLSGGQWQKIALARAAFALAKGRRLLVLDEPTAHLDVTAEASFNQRITELARGATVLLISHRLSTVRHADRVLVLSEGRIAEQGTHDELTAADGMYARMFRLQAGAFTSDRSEQEGV